MSVTNEGTIWIPLEEFWKFVAKWHPDFRGAEIVYGVPRVEGTDLVIDYATSDEGHPGDWAEKPKAVTQWDDHKLKGY